MIKRIVWFVDIIQSPVRHLVLFFFNILSKEILSAGFVKCTTRFKRKNLMKIVNTREVLNQL